MQEQMGISAQRSAGKTALPKGHEHFQVNLKLPRSMRIPFFT